MYERFTDKARKAMQLAKQSAANYGQIETPDIIDSKDEAMIDQLF